MNGLVNAVCNRCRILRPRCAYAHLRREGQAALYHPVPVPLCEGCRQALRGGYRLDERHR